MIRALLLGSILSAAAGALPAQANRPITRLDGTRLAPAEIDQIVTRLMSAARVPGVAIAILNRGEVAFVRGYGYRDVATKAPLNDTTTMYGASFTKSVFAYFVMQLVDAGVIDLDRPIEQYLEKPLVEFEKYQDLAGDERWRRITPRMLLSHTSGLPNWRFYAGAPNSDPDGKLRIYFEPGTRYAYSGEGINLLQFVIEHHTKGELGAMMRERVFAPLGMTRTSMTWMPEFKADFAKGYAANGAEIGHNARSSARAAGSMDTNVSDFAKFVAAVLRGTGLAHSSREAMLAPQIRIRSTYQFPTLLADTTSRDDGIRLSYGLGWGLMWTPYGKAYFKEGHDDGWANYTVTFDDKKTAIVIMTTSLNGEGIFKELLASLIGDRFTPWEWERYIPYDQAGPR